MGPSPTGVERFIPLELGSLGELWWIIGHDSPSYRDGPVIGTALSLPFGASHVCGTDPDFGVHCTPGEKAF